LLFDFVDFQNLVNELVTGKVRNPPAPLSDFLEEKGFTLVIAKLRNLIFKALLEEFSLQAYPTHPKLKDLRQLLGLYL
jgi:hypothetical protein